MVGLRDFGDDKGDVLMKYYDEEAKELKELGEIPEHIKINEGAARDLIAEELLEQDYHAAYVKLNLH